MLLYFSSCQQSIPEYKKKPRKTTKDLLTDPKYDTQKLKIRVTPVFPWHQNQKFVSKYKKGDKVWTPVPVNGSWKIVNFSQGIIIKNKKGISTLKSGNMKFKVPSVILTPVISDKIKLKKGDVVLANIGMTSQWGKITKINGKHFSVSFVWANEISTKSMEKPDVLPLKKAGIGTPVVFKQKKYWHFGKLIYKNSEKAWIIGFAGSMKVINISKVRFPDVRMPLKKRKIYKAPWFDKISEVKVLSIVNKGVGYKVLYLEKPEIQSRNPRIISFAKVFRFSE